MKVLIRLLVASSLVFNNGFVSAQELSLADCLKMADTANISIRGARLDMAINKKERDAYMSARLPHLTFSGDYRYNAIIPGQVIPAEFFGGPPGSFTTVAFGVPYNLGNTVQLSQVLFNPQLEYGLAALKVNAQIKELQYKMTQLEVKQQVAVTFYNLQAIDKQLAYMDANLANMDKLIKNMEALLSHDMLIQSELDKLNINKLSLLSTRESVKATRAQLWDYFGILIGLGLDHTLKLQTDSTLEQSLLVDAGEVSYPELELIRAQQRMNKEERKGTNMAYLPSLALYGAYNYNYNMEPAEDYRVGIEGAVVGLKLDWTLFDGLEKVHKQKVNALNAEKLSDQEKQLNEQLEMKTRMTKRDIEVKTSNLNLAKEQLVLAERVYQETKAKFEEGVIGSNDLILADNSLQEAQTNLVSAYVNLRNAEIEYLKTIGVLN